MAKNLNWRDKQKAPSSKSLFKKWFKGKKQLQDKIAEKKAAAKERPPRSKVAVSGGKGRGKGAAEGGADLGQGGRKGVGRGKAAGKGPRDERPRLSQLWEMRKAAEPAAVISSEKPPEGVSTGLMEQLLAVKRKLLGGKEEKTGVETAAPGESDGKGSGKGKGKGKGKDKGKGKGKGSKSDGKGKKRKEWEWPDDAAEPEAKKARKDFLWIAPASQVNREERVAMNRQIGEYAQVRDLRGARKTLAELEQRGWANGHTYAAAVNALCRCGDWQGAFAALKRAENATLFRKGAGIVSGLISRTAMLRGLCEGARDLGRAQALLERMEREKEVGARPNARTANTFLRGCLVLGAVNEAVEVLRRMEDEWSKDSSWAGEHGGTPDASSYEMVVALLCQALRGTEANKMARRALKALGPSPGSAAMFVSIARVHAIHGDPDAAGKAIARARELLSQEEGSAGDGGGSDIVGSGGKRGMQKKAAADGTEARGKSLEVFQTHRRGELKAEVKEIEKFMKKNSGEAVGLEALWARTLCFSDYAIVAGTGKGGAEDPSTAGGAAKAICRRSSERFGLSADASKKILAVLEAACAGSAARSKKKKSKRERLAAQKLAASSKGPAASTDSQSPAVSIARVDLPKLFQVSREGKLGGESGAGGSSSSSSKPRPVHLELCSGGGEWLTAQAVHEPSIDWVACELRLDRSSRCFQRFALHGLAGTSANVGLIAGDAHQALRDKLFPGCCSRVFVNHPEPPHQTNLSAAVGDGEGDSDDDAPEAAEKATGGDALPATHLLTVDFLRDGVASVLRPGGTLTICTDSKEYGIYLLRTLAKEPLNELFEDALKGTGAHRDGIAAKEGRMWLRSTAPPPDLCGAEYTGEAGSSYFQRLKLQEKSSRAHPEEELRYFICLKRS
eukprot:TRINITY_DN1880_c0_g3_i1.p1 TRINITY_DN1880_c0_g3~~TRINITY_DN1880_c0_g3_i1.p1  ORF type:complete len:904 (+),score=277.86 TRINITY_DN1880_c0_g3_i1:130-2841(+)